MADESKAEVSNDAQVIAAWISTAIKLAERVDRRPIVTKQDRQTAGRLIHPASLKILFDAMEACMDTKPSKEDEHDRAPVQG
ncbi:MAG: hypothetical protein JSV86_04940 [Gemmatimonadota bacterium]|nr:MAG: hypothetical protein JSV86_04940 [Gemmatimonadota bacterium]